MTESGAKDKSAQGVDWAPIATVDELEVRYGTPSTAAVIKVADHITPEYARLIEASRFVLLATAGADALDCSPRGDRGPVLTIADDRTILMPDWHGNNRIDSLRNIVRDPRVGLLCLIRGSGTTLRLNGRAIVTADEGLLAKFEVDGRRPRSVIVVSVGSVFFQCARAVIRSELWAGDWPEAAEVPTPGEILAAQSRGGVDHAEYDATWPGRAKSTLW